MGAMSSPNAEDVHHLEAQRRENRAAMADLGFDPYGERVDGLLSIAEARSRYDAEADEAHNEAGKEPPPEYVDQRPTVLVAGRVMLKRPSGGLVWLQLRDHTSAGAADLESDGATGLVSDLQVAVSKRDCAKPGFDLAKLLDLGDIVVAQGPLMKTRTGEVTVWASSISIACKSLAPPPEKWKGLSDIESRYRKRYVDLYANPEVMRTFKLRGALFDRLRAFMNARGDIEVETPILQTLAGGAAARPFVTHLNALSIDLFMRIAPELYLKRLIVGGLPGVYELSRNFRNEGIDRTHNPEFTMLEVYEAFGDYGTMMELTEGLVRDLATHVWREIGGAEEGPIVLPFGDHRIDYSAPFERVSYAELFERALGFAMTDHDRVRSEAKARGHEVNGVDPIVLVSELFENVAEPTIDPARPTFVMDYPAPLCPLTRSKKGDPSIAERFEMYLGGMEMANAYTELNDPDIQRQKFKEQLAGLDSEESTFRTMDEDFIEALKVGMPPAGGLGVGIDRLVMVLLDQPTIRDVLLFPMMRPIEGAPRGGDAAREE